MIVRLNPNHDLCCQWRRQILARFNPGHVMAREGFVALTFIDQAGTTSRFVDINRLLVFLVYDDHTRCDNAQVLRLSGYGVRRVPDGVQWGGADNCRIFKDLRLAPQYGARRQRLDRRKPELLSIALRLDRRVARAARYPAAHWPELRLPRLWAGFRACHVGVLHGQGPEFEHACRWQSAAPNDFFRASARNIEGLTCYQMDWVSDHLDRAVAVFAEMTHRFRRQTSRIGNLADGLIGFQGASMFDFYSSAFRG